MISLRGIPPLWGFLPKLVVVSTIAREGLVLLALYFSRFALFVTFYYVRIRLHQLRLINLSKLTKDNEWSVKRMIVLLLNCFGVFCAVEWLRLML